MAYVTNSDIQTRLGAATYVQLADDDGDGNADAAVVDEARLGAEGEVNSYLARRFQVPIDLSVNADLANVLKTVTLDLVEFRLRVRRPPVPDDLVRKHAQTMEWLSGVAEGRLELPSETTISASTAKGTAAKASGALRVYSRDVLSDL